MHICGSLHPSTPIGGEKGREFWSNCCRFGIPAEAFRSQRLRDRALQRVRANKTRILFTRKLVKNKCLENVTLVTARSCDLKFWFFGYIFDVWGRLCISQLCNRRFWKSECFKTKCVSGERHFLHSQKLRYRNSDSSDLLRRLGAVMYLSIV